MVRSASASSCRSETPGRAAAVTTVSVWPTILPARRIRPSASPVLRVITSTPDVGPPQGTAGSASPHVGGVRARARATPTAWRSPGVGRHRRHLHPLLQARTDPPVHPVDGTDPVDRDQQPLPLVVVDERLGLLMVDLQPVADDVLGVVAAVLPLGAADQAPEQLLLGDRK